MFIKPSKNRIEFERLLHSLNYNDRSVIYTNIEKERRQINYMCEDGSAMAIYIFIILYPNKKSYLYQEFLYQKTQQSNEIKKELKDLAKRIYFSEKTRVADVGWEAVYTKQPDQFSFEDRKKIIFDFLQKANQAINAGLCNHSPRPGDILAAKPYGPKINEGYNESSLVIGTRQRYAVARKIGFGSLCSNGFCYARYDDNLILRAI